MKIRSLEQTTDSLWEQFKAEMSISSLEGLLIGNTNDDLVQSVKSRTYNIRLTPIECIDIEKDGEDFLEAYDKDEWFVKIQLAKQLDEDLNVILKLKGKDYEHYTVFYDEDEIQKTFVSRMSEKEFISWWEERKGTTQTKKVHEARGRQAESFDAVLEKNGLSWGGNIDAILLDKKSQVRAIIETRNSGFSKIDEYDPRKFYNGTKNKEGDFNTWLPLRYLADTLGVPLILITFSRKSPGKCGIAVVGGIEKSSMTYLPNPASNLSSPNENVVDSVEKLKDNLLEIIVKYRSHV